jgi:hypothetical protein
MQALNPSRRGGRSRTITIKPLPRLRRSRTRVFSGAPTMEGGRASKSVPFGCAGCLSGLPSVATAQRTARSALRRRNCPVRSVIARRRLPPLPGPALTRGRRLDDVLVVVARRLRRSTLRFRDDRSDVRARLRFIGLGRTLLGQDPPEMSGLEGSPRTRSPEADAMKEESRRRGTPPSWPGTLHEATAPPAPFASHRASEGRLGCASRRVA